MDSELIKCYKNLVNAIILQATIDYVWALKAMKKQRRVTFCVAVINDIEDFFQSEYFIALSDLDGKHLITCIRKKCGYDV